MAAVNFDAGRSMAEMLAEFRHGEEWDGLGYWHPLDKTWTVKSDGKGYSVERRLGLNADRGGLILLEEQITHRLPAGPGVIAEVSRCYRAGETGMELVTTATRHVHNAAPADVLPEGTVLEPMFTPTPGHAPKRRPLLPMAGEPVEVGPANVYVPAHSDPTPLKKRPPPAPVPESPVTRIDDMVIEL